jgi:hypothetical protein
VLADLVDPATMPRVAEVARSGLLSPPPQAAPESTEDLDDLRFALDRILDGVEVFIERRRAGEA